MNRVKNITDLLLLALLLICMPDAAAQQISFRTIAANDITVAWIGPDVLEFDCLLAGTNMVSTIALTGRNNRGVAVLAIDAPINKDISVRVDVLDDNKLILNDSGNRTSTPFIPFVLRFAYANQGYGHSNTKWQQALYDAVEVPSGIKQIVFPISADPFQMASSGNASRDVPVRRAYLFFYGSIGPAGENNNVPAGIYQTTISVYIDSCDFNMMFAKPLGSGDVIDAPQSVGSKW